MLQAGRSRVQFVLSLDFSIDLILPSILWPWGSLSLPTEISTRNLPGGKGWLVHEADSLIAICVEYVGASTSQHYGPPWPVTGIALPLPHLSWNFYMVCSKSFGTFEIARQLDVLAMTGKLCCLVACFLINVLFAASSYCD
jgi:hypothetical protein